MWHKSLFLVLEKKISSLRAQSSSHGFFCKYSACLVSLGLGSSNVGLWHRRGPYGQALLLLRLIEVRCVPGTVAHPHEDEALVLLAGFVKQTKRSRKLGG